MSGTVQKVYVGREDRFSCLTFGEARTGKGQLVEFWFPSGNGTNGVPTLEQIKEFFRENIATIDFPVTDRVSISHGGYGRYTRYDVAQHKYAGGGHGDCGGYAEVLEIKNPPEGRWGIVTHEWIGGRGASFIEWETLQDAIAAFERDYWNEGRDYAAGLSGFKRRVVCGKLSPWFYAIGNQQLIGDYAFPEGLQDDPVYQFGKKFLVFEPFDQDAVPIVKTCMGTRFIEEDETNQHSFRTGKKVVRRLVYWDDGSFWDERLDAKRRPRLLAEDELWVEEAVRQFRELLAGKTDRFTINFTNGTKFFGRVAANKGQTPSAEGDYLCVVWFKGESEAQKGWVNDFKPTSEYPDIAQFVAKRYAAQGKTVERVEIKKRKTKKDGKQWAGVFFRPSA